MKIFTYAILSLAIFRISVATDAAGNLQRADQEEPSAQESFEQSRSVDPDEKDYQTLLRESWKSTKHPQFLDFQERIIKNRFSTFDDLMEYFWMLVVAKKPKEASLIGDQLLDQLGNNKVQDNFFHMAAHVHFINKNRDRAIKIMEAHLPVCSDREVGWQYLVHLKEASSPPTMALPL